MPIDITVKQVTENRYDDKMWWVMDDGLCFDRFASEEEATRCANELLNANARRVWIEARMDQVQEDIMKEFGYSPDDATRAMQEWLS